MEAWSRAVVENPPTSVRELKAPDRRPIALRCTLQNCRECHRFEHSGKQATYESHLERYRGISRILPWDCESETHRAAALELGVKELPAYIILSQCEAPLVVRFEEAP